MRTNYLGGQSIDWSGKKNMAEILRDVDKATGFFSKVIQEMIAHTLPDLIEAFENVGEAIGRIEIEPQMEFAKGGPVKMPKKSFVYERESPEGFNLQDSPCRFGLGRHINCRSTPIPVMGRQPGSPIRTELNYHATFPRQCGKTAAMMERLRPGDVVVSERQGEDPKRLQVVNIVNIHDEIQIDFKEVEMRMAAAMMEQQLERDTVPVLGGQRIPK